MCGEVGRGRHPQARATESFGMQGQLPSRQLEVWVRKRVSARCAEDAVASAPRMRSAMQLARKVLH